MHVVDKVTKRLNLLRCLTKHPWCNNKKTLTVFYSNAIRSVTEHGAAVYSDGAKNELKKIWSCQYKALKIISGVLHGTCAAALEVVCQVPPIPIRFKSIVHRFGLTQLLYNKQCMLSSTSNTGLSSSNCSLVVHDNNNPDWLKPVAKLLKQHKVSILVRSNISPQLDIKRKIAQKLIFDYSLLQKKPMGSKPLQTNWFNNFLNDNYKDHVHVYTDGSHIDELGSVSAISIPGLNIFKTFKLSKFSNSLLAEFFALFQALLCISSTNSFIDCDIVIFSDSLHAIHSLEDGYSNNHPLTLSDAVGVLLGCPARRLTLCWVPEPSDIRGSAVADNLYSRVE